MKRAAIERIRQELITQHKAVRTYVAWTNKPDCQIEGLTARRYRQTNDTTLDDGNSILTSTLPMASRAPLHRITWIDGTDEDVQDITWRLYFALADKPVPPPYRGTELPCYRVEELWIIGMVHAAATLHGWIPRTGTFSHLAQEVLPGYMAQIRACPSYQMSIFAKAGNGPSAALRLLERRQDFAGCYVLWEGEQPFYVGISRGIIARLIQHVRGTTQNDASLAYKVACGCMKHSMRRAEAMANPDFIQQFVAAKQRIGAMTVKFVQINNAVERYVFEVYASMELKTHQFNTFETH